MTGNEGVGLEEAAKRTVDGYLEEVKKELDGVDPKERKAILEEIDSALKEKIEILAAEKKVEKADNELVENVLEGFGSPSELARGYARVARTGPGRVMKLVSAFEAFWAAFIFIPGAFLFGDGLIYWWPPDLLTSAGQVMLGLFFIAGCIAILALISFQLRNAAIRPMVGPFSLLAVLALGITALTTYNIDRDYLFPGLPATAVGALLIALAVFLVLGSVWSFWSLLVYLRKDRATSAEEQSQANPRRFSTKGKGIIALTTVVLVSLFVLAEGLLMTGGWYGDGRPEEGDRVYVSSEYVGGPYNSSIEKWQGYTGEYWSDFYKIVYTLNGTRVEGAFDLSLRPVLDWIRTNTSSNATILCWWDYGHMVRGYTGRNAVIYYPSENLLDTVADKSSIKQFEPEERVRMVAETFLSQNSSDLQQGMQALGASHLLTVSKDASEISYAFFKGAGLDPWIYLSSPEGRQIPNDNAKDMFLFKIWGAEGFNGTKVDYKDIISQVLEPS